ncbi:TonB-dependent receptor [Roseovarius sp. M141]|nr:TonB-dependent receptor [Roseovarius sp. M141]
MCLGYGGTAAAQDGGAYLGTIVLGESKREVRTDTAVPVTDIDQTEIDDRQAGTVAELIDSVPGVTLVNGATPQGSGITIRGYGARADLGTDNKVLIQIDGATRGSEELYRIGNQLFTDPALYKKVEVIRGTIGSFQYGSGVVGGVVRLETKDASDLTGGVPGLKMQQTLELATNGEGFATSSILAWQPTEKLEFLANYTYRDSNPMTDGNGNLINPAGGGVNDPSWLIKGKLTFGEDDSHSIMASHMESESTQNDVPYDSFGLAPFFGNVDRQVASKTSVLRYRFDPIGNDLVNLSLQYSYSDERIDQQAVGPVISPLQDADHRYETTTVTLKNTALFSTGAVSHDLTAGVEYINRKRRDQSAAGAPGGEDNRWAMFAVDEMSFGGGWTVTPALRYETSSIDPAPVTGLSRSYDNDALMGGVSVRYAFRNGVSLFGSAAYTEVLPPIDDLGNTMRISTSEKALTYEIGGAYEREGVFQSGDGLAVKVNLYDTTLRDVTSYVATLPPVGPPMGPPPTIALDKVRTRGMEIEAAYAMVNGFYMDLNANITDGRQTDIAGVAQDWQNLAADSLRLTVGKKIGSAYDVSWEMVANDSITLAGVRSPDYAVHNIRATIAPESGVWKGTAFRIGIENVFDQQYQPSLSTRPAPGRNVKMTLTKTF